jgi:hypothetical protein
MMMMMMMIIFTVVPIIITRIRTSLVVNALSCEHDHESYGSINDGNFLYQLSYFQLLSKLVDYKGEAAERA